MKYDNIEPGIFIDRPDRFTAHVELGGQVEVCHVKNTGRCAELLIPGRNIYVQRVFSDKRKTKCDLISVYKGERLINIDSQAPNKAAAEYIPQLFEGISLVKPEVRRGDSRFDFYVEAGERKIFLEVKGVTLEENGTVYFPDAPTLRGVRHLRGLAECVRAGYGAMALFVIQMEGVEQFRPNERTHPEFAEAMRDAAEAGVELLAAECRVTLDEMNIVRRVPILL